MGMKSVKTESNGNAFGERKGKTKAKTVARAKIILNP